MQSSTMPHTESPQKTSPHPSVDRQPSSDPSSTVSQQTMKIMREDLYDAERCTLVMVIQWRPLREGQVTRDVVTSIQNGTENTEDLPLYDFLSEETLGELPPHLYHLKERLLQELPRRKQKHVERLAVKKRESVVAKTTNTSTRSEKKSTKGAKAEQPLPPSMPTTTNPIPKQELVMGGLFESVD